MNTARATEKSSGWMPRSITGCERVGDRTMLAVIPTLSETVRLAGAQVAKVLARLGRRANRRATGDRPRGKRRPTATESPNDQRHVSYQIAVEDFG